MCDSHNETAPKIVALNTMHRRDIVRRLWAGTMLVGVAGAAAGCETADAFFAPSDADLVPLAAEAWEQTKKETPISNNAAANTKLRTIGQKIAAVAAVPNAAWEFVVFDSKELNAFVLPGGKVGCYKGLIDFVENDSQLAAVLGHEAGHVVARHAALRASRQSQAQIGLALGGAALGSLSKDQQDMAIAVMGAGASVGVLLPFSRSNELEADKLGVDYMHAAGYDVKQSIRLWEKMGAAASERPTEWMSTHPNPETRIAELRAYITAKNYAQF